MKRNKKKFIKPEITILSLQHTDIIQTSYEFSIGQDSKNVLGGQRTMKSNDEFKNIWGK